MENTHVENNMSCDSVSDGFNYNGKRGYCLQLSTLFLQERLTAHCRVGTACSMSASGRAVPYKSSSAGVNPHFWRGTELEKDCEPRLSDRIFKYFWQLPLMFTNIFWASVLNVVTQPLDSPETVRSGPMWTPWGLARPSARSCTLVIQTGGWKGWEQPWQEGLGNIGG